jgi:hypothetical protein
MKLGFLYAGSNSKIKNKKIKPRNLTLGLKSKKIRPVNSETEST